ncbi:MAG: tyrosine-type recombinase/integrase [Deltaproteobacteria bacterium]|nr:tyrosine-type recombinase/integrase [Deltaproteobacteria bacterium]
MKRTLVPKRKVEIVEIKDILDKAIERFLSSLDTKVRTKETYQRALRVFQIWITDKGYARPTRQHILEYKDYLQSKTVLGNDGEMKRLSPLTVTAYLTALRRFFAFLEAEKVYPNIAKDIKGLKRPKGFLKDTLTKDEAKRLLEGIKEEGLASLRDYAMINLMLRTGLRTIEISRALIGDIGREGGETVLRVWGKGRDTKDDFVILTEEAYKPILDYLQARGDTKLSEPLFASHSNRNQSQSLTTRSIRRIIESRLKAVGLKTNKVTAHSLRHTAGTVALMNGADLLSVKEMLRHSNINTTLVYAHNLNRLTKGAEKFIEF